MLKLFRNGSLLSLLLAFVLTYSQAAAASVEIEVALEPEHTGVSVPVVVDVSRWIGAEGSRSEPRRLQQVPGGRDVPFELDRATGTLEFVIDAPQSPRPTKTRLRFAKGDARLPHGFRIENTGGKQLVVSEGERPVLTYNYGTILPEGVADKWRRSCYIHPMYGPYGERLTDDFPADHLHHRGLSWMWTHVKVGGDDYDLWAIKGICQRFSKLPACESGRVFGRLRVVNGWYTDAGRKVLDETVSIKVFRAGRTGRIVDLELTFKSVDEAVTIESSARGYGGLNFRFAPRKETSLNTSSGKLGKDVDRQRFLWSDLSAKFGESSEFSGVAIFDHPANPSHPTGWSNRFYGILNPSFTGIEPVTIKPDVPLRLRYRLWIHKGGAIAGNVAQAYKVFSQPPKVRVLSGSADKI